VAGKDSYLRPMLEAGSSRVFNCIERHRKLQAEAADDVSFFKHEPLHNVVVIKEVRPDYEAAALGRNLVTKLYLPYNQGDVYEGGRSVFLHDPKLLTILNELVGLQGPRLAKEDMRSDLKMLQVFDGLPSLDAFLLRDALELEGFRPNPLFLEVSEIERAAIYDYIRQKFEPLVRAALGSGSFQSSKVAYLVDKMWEAKDLDALDPLIEACRFPKDEALSIFTAWKGINFYTFEYERIKGLIESLGQWLARISIPRFGSLTADTEHVTFLKDSAIERLKHHTSAVEEIVGEYDTLYQRFVVSRDAVVDFIDFLHRSREIYWRMGEGLSALNHATHCWNLSTANYFSRRLPFDRLEHVLNCVLHILADERRGDRAGSANFVLARS
jgi:hypothetical protein